ncbi:MAG: hypothetical protein GF329_01995 [Candidatus Lokiarchaeota archaeon]|nr:hypothetical protein [Candidatus Lokiarchaeota archaeon]
MSENGITEQMKRLLYIIAEYTKKDERYGVYAVKDLPLKALIYYGIIKNVLDYDYAPQSVMYQDNRRYLNISQEGEDDLNDLRDEGLLNRIRLATKSHSFIYAYSLTEKGIKYIDKISEEDKKAVDSIVKCKCSKIYDIKIKPEIILFECISCGISFNSEITDIEDVAYKSTPFKIKTQLSK